MTSDNSQQQGEGLTFPCEYPVKAMGPAGTEFAQVVVDIVAQHISGIGADQVRSRDSKGGKYQSVTVTVTIESRQQLETIYMALRQDRRVLWTL